jgi:hypothetical protein
VTTTDDSEEERVGLLLSCPAARGSAGVYPLVFNVWTKQYYTYVEEIY